MVQVGAIRVNEQDRREAVEESEGNNVHRACTSLSSPSRSGSTCTAVYATAQACPLLDEEVFLSQLHRRAKLLSGNYIEQQHN